MTTVQPEQSCDRKDYYQLRSVVPTRPRGIDETPRMVIGRRGGENQSAFKKLGKLLAEYQEKNPAIEMSFTQKWGGKSLHISTLRDVVAQLHGPGTHIDEAAIEALKLPKVHKPRRPLTNHASPDLAREQAIDAASETGSESCSSSIRNGDIDGGSMPSPNREHALVDDVLCGNIRFTWRNSDKYVNATAMCTSAGTHWYSFKRTDRFAWAVERTAHDCGIAQDMLIKWERRGLDPATWIHPMLAVYLATWCDKDAEGAVISSVSRMMNGQVTTEESTQLARRIRDLMEATADGNEMLHSAPASDADTDDETEIGTELGTEIVTGVSTESGAAMVPWRGYNALPTEPSAMMAVPGVQGKHLTEMEKKEPGLYFRVLGITTCSGTFILRYKAGKGISEGVWPRIERSQAKFPESKTLLTIPMHNINTDSDFVAEKAIIGAMKELQGAVTVLGTREDVWRPVPLGVDPAEIVRQDTASVVKMLEDNLNASCEPVAGCADAAHKAMAVCLDKARDNNLHGLNYTARFTNGFGKCEVQAPSVDDQIKLKKADADLKKVDADSAAVAGIVAAIVANAGNVDSVTALTDALKALTGGAARHLEA